MLLSVFIILINTLFVLAIPPKEGSDNNPSKKYLVTDLPGLYENIKPKISVPLMFSGQLELYPENNTHYFFWKFVDSELNQDTSKKTIFWLNGGPGCSSMDGALLETGPFRIDENEKVIYNNGSWHKFGDIIYVDQPAGTGFSFTNEYITDLDQVAWYFLKFMEEYYKLFPNEINNEIYFAGESYAGQYIPYIADAILKRNKNLKENDVKYDLKGILIGNGWVSPNQQSLSYLPFFINHGLIDKSHPRWGSLLSKHEKCQKIVNKIDGHFDEADVHPYEVNSATCESILTDLLNYSQDRESDPDHRCINMYDYTLRDSYPSCGMNWPFELKYVAPFLRKEEVMHDLNLVDLKYWRECSGKVGRMFGARNSLPAVHLLPNISQEIPIILFNGANDIICNSDGVLSYLDKLQWGGKVGFTNKDDQINWIYDNKEVGYILMERNISFINIYNSSHMVPYDLPDVSRALMDLVSGKYEEKEKDGKREFITYPLGEVRNKLGQEIPADESSKPIEDKPDDKPIEDKPEETKPEQTKPEDETSSSTSDIIPTSETSFIPEPEESTSSKFTRLIQLGVIFIIFWGVYILYVSYRARPSSIIKKPARSTNSSGRKKNVQWADQLNRFEEDENELGSPPPQGIIAKTISKITGNTSNRGRYAPAGDGSREFTDDIELGEGISDPNVDEFIIGSDDDEDDDEDVETHEGNPKKTESKS
ncbi:Pheromone-processing carboxypeptidase KEX1 [Candida tropicalis]